MSPSSSHGFLYEYDKTYDRVNTKNEKPLQIIDRIRYNPTTSDDPVIQEVSLDLACSFFFSCADYPPPPPAQLAAKGQAQIFATDSILSMLMCTTRSVYPWDIVLTREGNKLFMDKREGGPFGEALDSTSYLVHWLTYEDCARLSLGQRECRRPSSRKRKGSAQHACLAFV